MKNFHVDYSKNSITATPVNIEVMYSLDGVVLDTNQPGCYFVRVRAETAFGAVIAAREAVLGHESRKARGA